MTPEVIERFRMMLSERFGWRLESDSTQLSALLSSRLRAGQTADAYLARLRAEPGASGEIRSLAESLAVSETYFFRNREQFAALAEIALPTVIGRRPAGPIRILSAGCASGEEPYSIAMTVRQVRAQMPVPPVEIVGVDVSRRALDKARQARYSPWALRGVPEDLIREFFDRGDRQFTVHPEIVAMVRFEERNLVSAEARAAEGPWDIVFFRNTCMYFTPEMARQIVAQLAHTILPGGFLFLGHAENLRGLSDDFELQHTHDTFYYVRRPAGAQPTVRSQDPSPMEFPAGDLLPAGTEWIDEIARATERVTELVDRQADVSAGARDRPPAPPALSLAPSLALLADERYEDALQAIGPAADPDRLLVRAVLLTHLGRLDEARTACARVLSIDGMHAGAHYLLALCDERSGDLAAAKAHDEMAIHLDATFAMPHLHLGLMLRRAGSPLAAATSVRAARERLMSEDSARIVLFGGGFGRTALLQICDSQLASLRP